MGRWPESSQPRPPKIFYWFSILFVFTVRQRNNNSIRLSEINNHSTKTLQQVLYVRDNKLKTESMFMECYESPESKAMNYAWNKRTVPMDKPGSTATTATLWAIEN